MQNKTLPIVIVLLILLLGGYFLLSQPKEVTAPPTERDAPEQKTVVEESATTTARIPKTYEVVYTADGFAPAVLNITVGDTVTFLNKNNAAFRPASNEHPTHTAYPEFDAKAAIDAGKTYEFTFTKPGKWGYHNHLNPKMMGVVIVK